MRYETLVLRESQHEFWYQRAGSPNPADDRKTWTKWGLEVEAALADGWEPLFAKAGVWGFRRPWPPDDKPGEE